MTKLRWLVDIQDRTTRFALMLSYLHGNFSHDPFLKKILFFDFFFVLLNYIKHNAMKNQIFKFTDADNIKVNGTLKYDLVNLPQTSPFYDSLEDKIKKQRKEYILEHAKLYREKIQKRVVEQCELALLLSEEDLKPTSQKYNKIIACVDNEFSAWCLSAQTATGSLFSEIEEIDELVDMIIAIIEKRLTGFLPPFDV